MAAEPAPRSRMVAAVFDRAAETYDQIGVPWFTPIAEHLVQQLAPEPGQRVLDAGCGRGAATFPLAVATGLSGRVIAIDLSTAMVEALRAGVEARRLSQVHVEMMDAAAPDLPAASFDMLASSLVLFFLPDPAAALANWRDLMVPGGQIGVSTFGPQDPVWTEVDDVFTPHLPPQLIDARTSGKTGPFSSDQGVETLFRTAGFTQVRTTHLSVTLIFRDVAQWQEWTWSHGQRAHWEAVPEGARDSVLAAAARALEAARDPSGTITLTQDVRYTLGRRSTD